MAHLDLNAARAARREAKNEAPTFALGDKTFTLPIEIPAGVGLGFAGMAPDDQQAQAAALVSICKALLGDRFEEFFEIATMDDIEALANGLSDLYGVDEGNSEASPRSSGIGTAPRRQSLKSTG